MADSTLFGMHIVMIGNPVDGVVCYGPFTTGQEAIEWGELHGETNIGADSWWIAPLATPSQPTP